MLVVIFALIAAYRFFPQAPATPVTVLSGTGIDQVAMLRPPPAGQGQPAGAPETVVAHALVPRLSVWASPSDVLPAVTLANPTSLGAPLVLLVRGTAGPWTQVFLPIRPNEAVGWVHTSDVVLKANDFAIAVRLDQRHLFAWEGDRLLVSSPVAVGASATPTPTGVYYLTALLRPPDPNGFYGPYAYGISGHSPTLPTFDGGDAEVGLHGTNDPSSIGKAVTHGCIRLPAGAVTTLAGVLPLGTPVFVG